MRECQHADLRFEFDVNDAEGEPLEQNAARSLSLRPTLHPAANCWITFDATKALAGICEQFSAQSRTAAFVPSCRFSEFAASLC
jgi:hypothetical protein